MERIALAIVPMVVIFFGIYFRYNQKRIQKLKEKYRDDKRNTRYGDWQILMIRYWVLIFWLAVIFVLAN